MNHNFFKLLTKELKFCFDLMDYILSRILLTFREPFLICFSSFAVQKAWNV